MPVKTIPFSSRTEVETASDIHSVRFDGNGLVIAIAKTRLPSGKVAGLVVTFSGVRGFRFLDEADLARYWISSGFPHGFHVIRVEEGGWATEEENLKGYPQSNVEWLVVTGNGCLNVFTHNAPSCVEAELEVDA